MFWGFKYDIFKNFRKFKREEVEVVFWESKAKPSEDFEFKICHRSILEITFEATLRSKQMFWPFENHISHFFVANFWVTKLKKTFVKARQSIQNCLNPIWGIKSIIESDFQATVRSKTVLLNLWKWHFSVFCAFLSDLTKIVFWERKPFKSNLGYWKHFRKRFLRYLTLGQKRMFWAFANFTIFQICEWQSWNLFSEKRGKAFKTA